MGLFSGWDFASAVLCICRVSEIACFVELMLQVCALMLIAAIQDLAASTRCKWCLMHCKRFAASCRLLLAAVFAAYATFAH